MLVVKKLPFWVMLFGIVCVAGAVYMASNNYRWLSKGTEATGTVIGHDSSEATRRPIVKFTTQDGQEITFTSIMGSSGGIADKGEQITVVYMSDNPSLADLKPGIRSWGFSIIFMLTGLGTCYLYIRQWFKRPTLEEVVTTNREQ